ncbi:hypothetical protein GCM10022381_20610 [Leifsonia kafniensis]|uniref:Uncharacterized protein n=1 Tax=Leifsonia kafniensis TaxID=475957 RepID=A0ABP7KIE8_9MICO
MRVNAAARSRVVPAARFSVLVIGAIAVAFTVASAIVIMGTGVSAADAALMIVQYPLVTATALVGGMLTLFLLIVTATPTTRWDLAWRGAVAACVSVAVAPLVVLLTAEWIPGTPGAAGGFFLVVSALVSFVLVGGPIWAGLVAILLRRSLGPVGQDSTPRGAQRLQWASPADRRRLGVVLCATGVFVALGITFLSYVPAMYKGADYKCMVEGPRSPLAEISERPGIVTGSFSLWPLGRECTWLRADGAGTVAVDSGNWVATGFAASALVLALVGGGLVASSRRVRPQPEPMSPPSSTTSTSSAASDTASDAASDTAK